jgi:hypothetical protein
MTEQAWTIAGGVVGGAAGYYLGKKNPLWTAVGALAGAILLPPAAASAMPALPEGPVPNVHTIELQPGKTIILRAQLGDIINVLAPSGWGVPSANANVPGFLEIESTSTAAESTTFKVKEGGQANFTMTAGGETAVLSIEVV